MPIITKAQKHKAPNIMSLMRHLLCSMEAASIVPIGIEKSTGVKKAIP